jgi:Ca2+-binding RTX toxin-like protein
LTATTTFNNSDTIDGGAGADILSLTQATTVGAAVSVSNVETLRLGGTGTATINMANVTGLTTIDLEVTAANTGVNTLQSMSGVTTITIDADDNTSADNDYQALTITNGYTGTADAMTINITSDATNGMGGTEGLITANGVETLTIASTGGENVQFGGFTSNTMTGITVTADGDFAAADVMTLGTLTGGTRTIATYNSSDADVALSVTVASLGNTASVTLGSGADTFSAAGSGGAGIVITSGLGIDNLTGSAQGDVIYAGGGNDIVAGGGGADTIYGEAGDDTLNGDDAAVDTISGGTGNDIIDGAGNLDVLTGGTGADTFVIGANADATATDLITITDFAAGAGGDILQIAENTAMAAAVGALSTNATTIRIGAIAGVGAAVNASILVITGGAGYGTDALARNAVDGIDTDATDVLIVYYNSTNNYAHVIGAATTNTSIHIASLTNITTVAGMANFTAGNFDVV